MATHKEINHDGSTTLSDHYDTIVDTSGGLSVIGGAALGGSALGVRADFDAGTSLMLVRDAIASYSGKTELTWRLMVDFANLSNSSGNQLIFGAKLDDAPTVQDAFSITISFNGTSTIAATALYYDDLNGLTDFVTVNIPTSGEICLEIRATKETADGNNDGEVEFFVDGVSKGSVSSAQNFNNFDIFDRATISFSSQNATLSGTMDYDEWILDDSAIADVGCSTIPNFNYVLGGGQP